MVKKRSVATKLSPTERRKRGTRIKSGLGDLNNLDAVAPPKARSRVDVEPDVVVKSSAATWAATDDSLKVDVLPVPADRKNQSSSSSSSFSFLPLSSCGSPESVFGHGWEEWRHVKQLLFHTQDITGVRDARRSALNRIQCVWQARVRKHRPLPAYVEATALLMEAKSLDEENQLSSLGAVTFYGAAISRSLHLMTGTFARGAADTYRKRARMIGFPEEAVEVRQRVAHGSLPLLSELRWVCGLVLQFLFRHYWMEQERQVRLMEKRERDEKEEEREVKEVKEAQDTPPRATVEEMRQLLEELSDGGAYDTDDSSEYTEVLKDGWKLY